MSTCNGLDLQTLESQPIMPKNLPDHYLRVSLTSWIHIHYKSAYFKEESIFVLFFLVRSIFNITFFIAITMLCWTDNILQNIRHIQFECEVYFAVLTISYIIIFTLSMNVGIFCRILSIPQTLLWF